MIFQHINNITSQPKRNKKQTMINNNNRHRRNSGGVGGGVNKDAAAGTNRLISDAKWKGKLHGVDAHVHNRSITSPQISPMFEQGANHHGYGNAGYGNAFQQQHPFDSHRHQNMAPVDDAETHSRYSEDDYRSWVSSAPDTASYNNQSSSSSSHNGARHSGFANNYGPGGGGGGAVGRFVPVMNPLDQKLQNDFRYCLARTREQYNSCQANSPSFYYKYGYLYPVPACVNQFYNQTRQCGIEYNVFK